MPITTEEPIIRPITREEINAVAKQIRRFNRTKEAEKMRTLLHEREVRIPLLPYDVEDPRSFVGYGASGFVIGREVKDFRGQHPKKPVEPEFRIMAMRAVELAELILLQARKRKTRRPFPAFITRLRKKAARIKRRKRSKKKS